MRAQLAPLVLGAHRVRAVLDHVRDEAELLEARLLDACDPVEVRGDAAPVHDHDDLRRGRELGLEVFQAHVGRLRVGVHPLDAESVGEDRPVRCRAGERAREHLVDLRLQARPVGTVGLLNQVKRQVQARRGGVQSQHMLVQEELPERCLELLHLGALRDHPRVDHGEQRSVQLLGRCHEHLEQRDIPIGRHVPLPRATLRGAQANFDCPPREVSPADVM